ncbi:LysR family transcriptional regulator [Actinomycetospora termitidis]|uniref:LysR family transcriptional regulator n=1 Tax=Actinomycetospora termitidis TaxID=3053470 RepID=A0ABT7MAC0_9PSEU|nr:LysR family transcriptional regulator [Actinomycetospora sp. Odt1-22]MDL5156782.1 LysR family transcriptional regulator [Actinomycetospora sp. Odt1-22]
MELRQLAYFEAVARCGGFTRAAEDLLVAQPAISAQVRRLESELGVALLARTTRRVALTEAGELFLTRARRVLAELAAARAEAEQVAHVVRGSVAVGATGVLGGFDLPGTLAVFARGHPGVSLSLRTGLVDALVDDLAAGALDLVLGPIHPDPPSGIVATPLAEDRLVLVTPPGRTGGDLVGFAGEPFVCLPADSGLRHVLDGLAARLGVELPVRFEASTPSGVRELVGAGLGVALLAASAVDGAGAPVEVHEVVPATAHPPFGLLHRESLSPAAAALAERIITAGR